MKLTNSMKPTLIKLKWQTSKRSSKKIKVQRSTILGNKKVLSNKF